MTPQEAEELAALWTGAQAAVAAFIRTLVRRRDDSEELLQRTAVALVRKHRHTIGIYRLMLGPLGCQDGGARILASAGPGSTSCLTEPWSRESPRAIGDWRTSVMPISDL